VPHDDLAGQSHAAAQEPELAAAVRRLVQVHKVHVNRRPGDVAIELRVQVRQRLAQRPQAADPHLGRRKRMHPGDQPDAVRGLVRFQADVGNRLRRGQDGLEDDLDRDLGRFRQRLGDDLGMLGNLFQRRLAVQMLAASDEPDFE